MIKKIRTYRSSLLQIVLILCVSFSLVPCSVKGTVLGAFDVEYKRPLNKSKAIARLACETQSSIKHSVAYDVQVGKRLVAQLLNGSYEQTSFLRLKNSYSDKYSGKQTSGNSPPLYILYKRFKFDLA